MNFPKAFIFDLNGTMIDDMSFHQNAWYKIVHEELNSPITFEALKGELYGKNEELLWRVFPGREFSEEGLNEISNRKEQYYQESYRPHVEFIAGLKDFLATAKRNEIGMAIGSAAVPGNINFILDNLDSRHYFTTIVSASDVKESKPHPDTFLKAAALLGVSPQECVVFEDAPKGVESARNAGMKCVVITTTHTQDDFKAYDNILMFVSDYMDLRLNTLFQKN